VKGTKEDALEPSEEGLLLDRVQKDWGFQQHDPSNPGTLDWLKEEHLKESKLAQSG